MGESDFPYRRGCSLLQPETAGGIHMGESDFPVKEAALFYSPRLPEKLEEYTWVSQTFLK